MLNYAIYSGILEKMSGLSDLTPYLKVGSGNYAAKCLIYLEEFQAFADMHKLYISHDIAIGIEKLLVFKPDYQQNTNVRVSPRKEKDAYAVKCVEEIFYILKEFIKKDMSTFDECSDLWRQILARAILKYPHLFDSIAVSTSEVFNVIIQDSDLLPYYTHILGLIGAINAKVILDITLPQISST